MLTSAQRQELEGLLASNQKIAAIKRFREITGVGLQEALHAVEQLAGGGAGDNTSSSHRPHEPKSLREAESAAMAAIREGNVIEAIKRYRSHTGIGLKEAKDAIDALSVVHRSDGRVDSKLARSLIDLVAAGRKPDAITQLITAKGYDEAEARAFIATLGALRVGGQRVGAGCVRLIVGLLVIAALAGAAFLLWMK